MELLVYAIVAGCLAWAASAGLLAVRYCEWHGASVNPAILGIEMLKCLSCYKKLTREETGHVGSLFYHFVIPINAALVLAIVLLVVELS